MSYPYAAARPGLQVDPPSQLCEVRHCLVDLGRAPDGLPWLLEVDRTAEVERLRAAVMNAFRVGAWEELPENVRRAVERDVAAGLMGVHRVQPTADSAPIEGYVSRNTAASLLGPTVLSRLLGPAQGDRDRHAAGTAPNTAALPVGAGAGPAEAMADAVERAIGEHAAGRHVLLTRDRPGSRRSTRPTARFARPPARSGR